MKTCLTWKKGLFSSLYQVYSNGALIGNIEDIAFSKSVRGSFNGKDYIFKSQGFLKQNVEIIDSTENKVIGTIEYNNWMTKAEMSINSKKINWKYDNFQSTQWSLFDSEGKILTFIGSITSGLIYCETEDPDGLLVLSGLFVTHYYWQITLVVLLLLFIPLIM